MWTSLYYGQWDYWELRHKVTFDGVNRLILINDGVTDVDMQRDVYSAWKEWVSVYDNLKYYNPFNAIGGDPTIVGQSLDVTYFLINAWKFKPYSGQYNLNIVGNVYDVDGGDIKIPADIVSGEPNNITININTSNIVRRIDGSSVSGSGGLTVAENETLYRIDGNVIAIQSLLASPVTASLEPTQALQLTTIEQLSVTQSIQLSSLIQANISQSTQITDLQSKLFEVWQLHGLDVNNPLLVTQTARTFDTVSQTIETIGSGSTQETTIYRN